jgi:hypothetical protein
MHSPALQASAMMLLAITAYPSHTCQLQALRSAMRYLFPGAVKRGQPGYTMPTYNIGSIRKDFWSGSAHTTRSAASSEE